MNVRLPSVESVGPEFTGMNVEQVQRVVDYLRRQALENGPALQRVCGLRELLLDAFRSRCERGVPPESENRLWRNCEIQIRRLAEDLEAR